MKNNMKNIFYYIVLILIAFIYSKNTNSIYYPLEKNFISIGTITSIPEDQYQSYQFVFKPEYSNYLIWLNWPHPPNIHLHIGEQWKLAIRVKPTDKYWLKCQQIYLQGTVQFNADNQIMLPRAKYSFLIEHIREWIYLKIKQQLQISSTLSIFTGFISALTTGIRSDITMDQWADLRATGTNHLMAIAGLHIGFLSWIIYRLSNFCWRRSEKLMLWKPAQTGAISLSFFCAVIYSALSGFSLPTQRAIVMFGFFVAAKLARIKIPIGTGFLFAMLMILILQPISIDTATFWLSFTAVGLLIYTHSNRIGKITTSKALIKAQFVLAFGLAPLGLFFFQQTSLLGFLANMIAIPFIGFIILPLCLMGIIFHTWWTLAANLLNIFWPLMHELANIPYTQWHTTISLWDTLSLFWGVLVILAPKGFPHRWVGVLGCLPLITKSWLL